jgi:nicotinic acid mononucleotide adenylyltransferase
VPEAGLDLAPLRRLVEAVAALPAPSARVIRAPGGKIRSIAVLPGAFNPPTLAHLELARAAARRSFDAVVFSLGTRTIGKDEAQGLLLEERLYLLDEIAQAEERLGVIVQNRGLYVDQAEAIRAAFPTLVDLAFVVGSDKIPQIFDPRYYGDLAASLAALFARARLIVAARGRVDRSALDELLERPEALPYVGRIERLDLGVRWRDLSATRVRERLARGEVPGEWLPPNVARYLGRRRAAVFTSAGR